MARDNPSPLIRVRFAPSPTGPLHVGGARTALFNWLFARQNGGVFILRIEDTDRERSKKEFEDSILNGLSWLGLDWDEGPVYKDSRFPSSHSFGRAGKIQNSKYVGDYGPYRQSERTNIYKKYLEKFLEEGRVYWCYCTKEELEAERQAMLAQGLPPKYGGHCRNLKSPPTGKKPQVIRFKTPEAPVEFKDIIRGKVSFDASLFGDIAIAKDLETPLYNFAAAVDDEEMKITHVVRGEDHISNTPKQILFQRALGFRGLEYAHLPLILSADRSKLSKRYAETSLLEYRDEGYLPEAIVNFLALLGWHSRDEKEILNRDELVKEFELKRVQKAGAVFNVEKLDWLQKEYLRKMSNSEITKRLLPLLEGKGIKTTVKFASKVAAVEKTRLKTINEIAAADNFFFKLPNYDGGLLRWQNDPSSKTTAMLAEILKIVTAFKKDDLDRGELSDALADLISREGRGTVLWPMRVALTGRAASPDPLEIAEVLGRAESLRRIKSAITKIENL